MFIVTQQACGGEPIVLQLQSLFDALVREGGGDPRDHSEGTTLDGLVADGVDHEFTARILVGTYPWIATRSLPRDVAGCPLLATRSIPPAGHDLARRVG